MIETLIEKLGSIHDSERGAIDLVALGDKAIPLLRKFLLEGKPASVFQPRMNAVMALAQLGAKDALIEYLKRRIPSHDPSIRFGEEAVWNTALRELVRWHDQEVATVVMDFLRERPLPGACEAAGKLRLFTAAPYLVDALSDDVSRPSAVDALRAMLPEAACLLREAALNWAGALGADDDPILHRRAQAAMRLLAESDLPVDEAEQVGPMLAADDTEIVTCAARIQLKTEKPNIPHIVSALIAALRDAPWFVRDDIRELLAACGPAALPLLDLEIQQRTDPDALLPTLLNVKRQINRESQ